MKRAPTAALVAMLTAVCFAACRHYLPANRYLQPRRAAQTQSTADARGKFSHERHGGALRARGVTCLDCHRFDALIQTSSSEAAKELSRRALHPGSAACHACHVEPATRMRTAPTSCLTCHENLQPLRPVDHDLSWIRLHGSVARAQPLQCESCHQQTQCIDCHQRRDTIQTRVHERNFRFFHSVAARANPMQCGSCHRQDYCSGCHQKGKVNLP